MIESLLTARLKTVTPNVYPDAAPLNYKTPCVVYQRIDTDSIDTLDGESGEAFVTFQFSISAKTLLEAKNLARAVRNSLNEWDDDDVQTLTRIDESSAVDNSTDVTLHRVLLFFQFLCAD